MWKKVYHQWSTIHPRFHPDSMIWNVITRQCWRQRGADRAIKTFSFHQVIGQTASLSKILQIAAMQEMVEITKNAWHCLGMLRLNAEQYCWDCCGDSDMLDTLLWEFSMSAKTQLFHSLCQLYPQSSPNSLSVSAQSLGRVSDKLHWLNGLIQKSVIIIKLPKMSSNISYDLSQFLASQFLAEI